MRRHVGKFVATIVGVALLLTIVLLMNGIYQGNIADGVWLIEITATDLWVVERGGGGLFNESSRLPADSHRSEAATPGVAQASPLAVYPAQRELGGRSQQFTIIGYDVFGGLGGSGLIVRGRMIRAAHDEAVLDRKRGGGEVGETVVFGTRRFTTGCTSASIPAAKRAP